MKKLTMEWLHAALIRAIRTMAQTALGMFTIGAAVSEINWMNILSVAFVSGVYSILMSISTGLPESSTDGAIVVDTSGEKDLYSIEIDGELAGLSSKSHVTLRVINNSQQ